MSPRRALLPCQLPRDGAASAPDPGPAWLDAPLERQRAALAVVTSMPVLPGVAEARGGGGREADFTV